MANQPTRSSRSSILDPLSASCHAVTRRARALCLALVAALSLTLLGSAAVASNDIGPFACGTWPYSFGTIFVTWKWGPNINQSGNWAYAFASVAEPTWDNSFSKVDLGYHPDGTTEFDTYYLINSSYGYAYVWCYAGTTTISNFHAEGNTYWNPDNQWNNYMGNVAGQEIGHGLGLAHSNYPAVMQQGYTGSWPTSDDVEAINEYYP